VPASTRFAYDAGRARLIELRYRPGPGSPILWSVSCCCPRDRRWPLIPTKVARSMPRAFATHVATTDGDLRLPSSITYGGLAPLGGATRQGVAKHPARGLGLAGRAGRFVPGLDSTFHSGVPSLHRSVSAPLVDPAATGQGQRALPGVCHVPRAAGSRARATSRCSSSERWNCAPTFGVG